MRKIHSLTRKSLAPRVLAVLCALVSFLGIQAQTAVWTPATGGSLAGTSQMKVEISDFSSFENFTGIRFNWVEIIGYGTYNAKGIKSSVVARNAVTVTKNGNAATLSFNVPAEVKDKNGVVVMLDGVDRYSAYTISAAYNNQMATEFTPENLAKVEFIGGGAEGSQVSVTLAQPLGDGETLTCYLTSDTGEYISEMGMQVVDNKATSEFKAKNALNEGSAYRVELLVFDGDRYVAIREGRQPKRAAAHIILGASEVFSFSPVKWTGETPENETDINSTDNEITVRFSGPVTVDKKTAFINEGQGMTLSFQDVLPVGTTQDKDGKTYASEWKLVINESYLEKLIPCELILSLSPRDLNGKVVEGNAGREEGSYIELTYGCWWNSPELNFSPASGQTVNALKRIVASDKDLICIGENYGELDRKITVKNEAGDDVNTTITVTPANIDPSNDQYTFAYIDFDPAITAPGKYTVDITGKFFTIGEQFSAEPSKAASLEYNVDPTAVVWEITPEKDLFVYSLKDIEITFTKGTVVAEAGIASKIEFNSQYAMTPAQNPAVKIEGNVVTLSLSEEVKEPSHYLVKIPAGYFLLNGKPSEAINCEWELVEPAFTAEISVDPEPGNVKSLKEFVLTYLNIDEVAPSWNYKPVLLDADKNTVATGEFETMDDWNKLKVVLDKEITEDGNYVLSIPAESVNYGESCTPSKLEEFKYFIGRTYTIVPDPDKNQQELTTFSITYAKGASAKLENNKDCQDPITLKPENGDAVNITAVKFDAGTAVLTLDAPIVAEGKYTLSVPAKKFFINGGYSDAVEEVYTVASPYEIVPANRSYVESLKDFTLTFKEAFDVGVLDFEGKMLLKDAKGGVVAEIGANKIDVPTPDDRDAPMNVATFSLSEEVTAYGEYTLEIPEGLFAVDNVDAPAISFLWTIGVPYSITPNPAGTLDELSKIVITFDEGAVVAKNDDVTDNITLGDSYSMTEPAVLTNTAIEGNVLTITLDKPVEKSGYYRFFLPEGKFTVNGRKCSEIEVTYDVLIPFVAEIEITPAADGKNVASLKEFTLTFKNVFEAGIDENSTENVQLFDKDGNEVAYASKDAGIEIPVPDSMDDPMNVIKITLNKEITAKGEYKLVVPAALFILDNENSNERLEFTYLVDVSGVEMIGAEADAYTVYTISGIRVLVNASSDEVKALPAGLYIINGKKVYIAK